MALRLPVADSAGPIAWRNEWRPAMFRGAEFHVDTGAKESGRRIVTHEFPKKDLPYSEDMGRKAIEFTVRGYLIAYPQDMNQDTDTGSEMFVRDYRIARNRLITALETEGYAELQLPLLPPMQVVCTQYRVTEETKLGGYCVFDMSFVEFGLPPSLQRTSAIKELQAKADAMRAETERAAREKIEKQQKEHKELVESIPT